tara:strand:- start:2699 stop:2956 length:258 start_codon:yes stop_codon:yes gene_type:complete
MNGEEKHIHEIVRKWKRQHGGSGGETAIVKLIKAMCDCGLTSACIGVLGQGWQHDIKTVLADQDALDRVARHLWWGEDPAKEEEE